MNYAHTVLPLFDSWLGWSGSIPELFYNVDSYEQSFMRICKWLSKLTEYSEMMGYQVNADSLAIEQLAHELATLKETFGDEFENYFKERICEWLYINLECIIGNAAKFVQFGLDDTGRLVVYIPGNWDFLEFETKMDYSTPEYGRLAIVY